MVVEPSSVRPSVRPCVRPCVRAFTFSGKLEYLYDNKANRNQILSKASLRRGKGRIRFWARSDQNSGFYGNR